MYSAVCKLSVVCPAFEEEKVLPRFHAELCAALAPLQPEFQIEIVYVDDGSCDRTLDFLRRLARTDPRVQYLSFSRNFGQQAALTAGMEHACGDIVITLDSDMQHPPVLIPTLVEKWKEGHDIVLTLREDDPRLSYFKRLTSRAFYQVMRWLSDMDLRAGASDYRLMTRKALDSLLQLHETHRFLRGMVNWLGFPTTTVRFAPDTRGAGVSKYTLRRMVSLALDGMLSFSKLPLRLSFGLGMGVLLGALGYAGFAVLQGLFGSGPVGWGYHILLLAVLLTSGCVLSCLGIVGEYLARVYEQVKVRPLYLLKETSPRLAAAANRLGADRRPYAGSPPESASAA
jgi:dolichol-phosphate mannosyltransferase